MNLFDKIRPKKSGEVCVNCGAAMVEGCDFCPKCASPRGAVKQEICPVCGMVLTEEYDFCPKCAAPRKAEKPNTCPVCGFALREDQVFCPKCGKRLEAEKPSMGTTHGSGQNAEKTAKTKKRGVKILAAVVAVVLLLGVGGYVGYTALAKPGQKAVELVKAGDCSGAAQVYEKLNSVSKKLCRGDMITAFVALVKANPYLPEESTDYLISPAVMEQYAEYQQLSQTLDITSSDGTNVTEYIDAVLELQPYLKYNEIYVCVYKTIDSYTSGNDKVVEESFDHATAIFQIALDVARKYDYQEYLVLDYQKALGGVIAVVRDSDLEVVRVNGDWKTYVYFDSTAYASATKKAAAIFDEVENAVKEVDAINQALPVLQ